MDDFQDDDFVTPIVAEDDGSFSFAHDLDEANGFIHVSKWTRGKDFLGQVHETDGTAGFFVAVTPEMIDAIKITYLVMGDAQMTIDCVMLDRS